MHIGPSLSLTGGHRTGFGIAKTAPDLWLAADRGVGTTGARAFDGTDQRFELPSNIPYGSASWTIETWLYSTDISTLRYVIGTGGAAGVKGAMISMAAGGTITAYASDATVNLSAAAPSAITASKWTHVVAVRDNATGFLRLYMNGVLVQSTSLGALADCTNASTQKTIGNLSNSGGIWCWKGSLSRARIACGYAYTLADVVDSYNQGNGKFYAELSAALMANITHAWNLNEAGNTNANDVCTPSYDGVQAGTSTNIAADAGPREATASDSVGGYHGVLTSMDTVNAWSTDTPDGSYTATKQDSVGTAHGTMTGFTDIDLAHVDGPDGEWGPYVPDDGTGDHDAWIVSSVKDTRSTSIPSSLNVRAWDEAYTEPTATGSRWFDGVDQRFAMTTNPAYGTANVTIEAWVYPTTYTAKRTIIGTGGNAIGELGIQIWTTITTGTVVCEIADASAKVSTAVSPALTAYQWHHVLVAIDRTANTASMWIDGALCVVQSTATVAGSISPTATRKAIGAYDTGGTVPFIGAISRLKIALGSAYTAADVAEAYNGGKGRAFTDYSAGLATKVTYAWELNEATAATATCIKGSNDATQAGTDAVIKTAASPYLPAYDATLTGFTTSPRSASDVPTCLVGKCKSIQGADGKYLATGVKTLSGMGARSVSIWFKRNGNPAGNEYIISEAYSVGSYGFRSIMVSSGAIAMYIWANALLVSVSSAAGLCDNAWHHAVFTWDGSTTANKTTLTIDNGTPVTATAPATSQGGASSYNLQIFGWNGTSETEFPGLLCRPQIFAGRALTAGEVATLYAGGDVTEGLTAEWRFMEADAITVPFTHSMDFDGANSKVDCGHEVIGAGARTVSAWVNLDTYGGGGLGRIIDNGKAILFVNATGVATYSSEGGGLAEVRCAGISYATGAWVHVAATSNATGFASLFVNGTRVNTTTINSTNSGAPADGTSILAIGNRGSAIDRGFDGRIGQVQVHNSVLTQAQIRTLAQGGSPATPVGSWKFDTPLDLPSLSGCKAISCNGTTNVVVSACPAPTSAGTLAAWFRHASYPGGAESVIIGTSSTGRCAIATYNNYLSAELGTISRSGVLLDNTVNIAGSVWHHAALTWSGTTANLYLDGVLLKTATIAGLPDGTAMCVGAYSAAPALPSNGSVADARVYSTALTQSQIRSIISGSDYLTGLTARWKFGEVPRSIASCAGGYSIRPAASGTTQYVRTAAVPAGTISTIALWIKRRESAREQHFMEWQNAQFCIDSANRLLAYDGANFLIDDVEATVLGQWHHIAWTRNGSTGRLYVDGIDVRNASQTFNLNPNPITIGNSYSGTGSHFNGNIDDARVYASCLSQPDILLLSQGGEPTTAPTARWRFDDGPQYGEPSDGDPIATWEDRAGNQLNQITAANRPTYVQSGQNGKPGLGFNGTSQYLEAATAFLNGASGTVIAVGKTLSNAAAQSILNSGDKGTADTYYAGAGYNASGYINATQKNNDAEGNVYGSTLTGTANVRILALRTDGAAYTARVDGVAQTMTGTNVGDWMADTTLRDCTAIGARVTSAVAAYMNGVIYEIIAYDRALSDAELAKVERKLATKYGITI